MIIRYSRAAQKWFNKHKVSLDILTAEILKLCKREGSIKAEALKVHIMPRAIDSNYDYWLNTLNVAVESKAIDPRYLKIKRVCRNLLHELRHFIQFRIHNKPFKLTYTMRDMTLLSSKYWNDPDEVDARKYERLMLRRIYKKII